MRHLILIVVLVSLLGMTLPTSATPSLKRLSPHLADIPTGCVLASQALLGSAALARQDGAGAGGEAAFIEEFLGDPKRCPFYDLAALLTRYTSSAKAQIAYRKITRQRPTVPRQHETLLALPELGNEQLGVISRLVRQQHEETDIGITFRRDRYLFALVILGASKRFTSSEAVHISRLVDGRIQQAQ